MRSKQKNISAKAYKILSLVLAFTVLVSGLGVWYISGTSNTVEAATQYKDIEYVGLDLYDYYYDNQILNGQIDQGTQGGIAKNASAYSIFNSVVSDKFKNDFPTTNYPLYFGGFWHDNMGSENEYAGVYNDSLLAYIQGNSYFNFQWAVNLAQRGRLNSSSESEQSARYRASVQGLYGSSAPYFDSSFLSTQVTIKEIEWAGITNIEGGTSPVDNWTNNDVNNKLQSGYSYDIDITGNSMSIKKSHIGNYQGTTTIYLHVKENLSSWKDKSFALLVKNSSNQNVNIPFEKISEGSSQWDYRLTLTDDQINTYGKNSKTSSIGAAYENLKFPFYHAGNGYYVFNSMSSDKIPSEISEDLKTIHSKSVYYDPTTNQIYKKGDAVNGTTVGTVDDSTGELGFFPFNLNTTTPSELNYGFGARFTIDFHVSPEGKDANGNEIEFTFAGDDDVWVLLDNNLVLDLGGAHKNAVGKINFATKQATILTGVVTDPTGGVGQNIQTAGTVNLIDILENSTAATQHTITVLYMERGMLNSNLFMSYNFTAIPNENTLTVENKVNAENVNAGLRNQTYAVADNDVFEYTLANKGTDKGDVDSTGVQYPEYDYIKRFNTQATGNPFALLSGQNGVESTREVMRYIYLNPTWSGGNWTNDSAKIYAWVWKNENGVESNKHVKQMETVDVSGTTLYRVEYNTDEYNCISFVRVNPTNLPNDNDTTFPTGKWNQSPDLNVSTLTSNLYKITGWDNSGTWGSEEENIKETVTITTYPTEDNKYLDKVTGTIDKNIFYPVANTNYALTDPFAKIKGTDNTWSTYDDTIAGKTDDSGKLNLMYNETAKFTGQFKKGSTMQIVQENALKTPTVRKDSEVVKFDNSSGRTVDNYYTTTITLTGTSSTLNNNQFSYDSSTTSSSNVHITETFTNKVKTGDLTIIKNVAKGDTSEAGTFTFQVTLNNLFGSSGTSVSDYSGITYKLYSKEGSGWSTLYTTGNLSPTGTFTMGPNQKVVIEGIPVDTTYTVEETTVGSNYHQIGDVVYENANKKITFDVNDEVTVTNERRTGSLILSKDVRDVDNTDVNVTEEDKAKEFTFEVTLTAPTGVDLSKYDIVGGTVSTDKKTITVNVSENIPVTITGIPYGTGYTIKEESIPEGWEKVTTTDPNGTISSDTQTATIVNKKNIVLTTEAYLTITKYIDSLYYNSSDNPHGFTNENYSIISGNDTTNDAHGYLKYTNAEQVFTFKVEKCYSYDESVIETYQVLLKFPADSTKLTTPITNGSVTYNYSQSKKFKVEPGYIYKVTETNTVNGLSWRYDFVEATGVFGSINSTITNVNEPLTFTYAESAVTAQNATATFYDKRNTTSNTIESDMSSITNNITEFVWE